MKRARGMMEHLIDAAMDESFSTADAHEQVARLRYVSSLVAEEDDPIVRSLTSSYADQIADRIDIVRVRSLDAFRALEEAVRKTIVGALPPASTTTDIDEPDVLPEDRALSRAIVGALVEFPEIVVDPAIASALAALSGAYAQAAAGITQAWTLSGSDGGGDEMRSAIRFLGHLPESLHPFAFSRLAAPEHDSAERARAVVLQLGEKLRHCR